MPKKLKITKPGTVQKIIPGRFHEPEKAEIRVEGADHLYREIRIENSVEGADGHKAKLKPGAEVEVTVKADPKETVSADEDEEETAASANR